MMRPTGGETGWGEVMSLNLRGCPFLPRLVEKLYRRVKLLVICQRAAQGQKLVQRGYLQSLAIDDRFYLVAFLEV